MKVAGREDEIHIMQRLVESSNSEFLAMYGRRRIGKTYLIRQVYESKMVFDCSGIHEKEMPQQLENFWLSLIEKINGEKPPLPNTWLQAFHSLKQHIKSLKGKQKKVIFLDEVAWFETPKSGFLAALDNFWNTFCTQRNDIILVICGSAASWIIDKVINNKGGLHNRATCHIHLKPFTLSETKHYLAMQQVRLTAKDLALLYMCIGGVPYYLKDIKPGLSVPQILDQLFFVPQASLKNEFKNLYASLFKNSDLHQKIVGVLALAHKGMTRNEILQNTGLSSGGGFSMLLDELVQCGFLMQIMPLGNKKEDILFRLMDEYSIFYFKFLQNTKANNSWMYLTNTQAFKIWSGFAFENVCFRHIYKIKQALGIQGMITNEYSWVYKGSKTEKGAQIDLILERSDNCLHLFELKFRDAPFEISKEYAQQLELKREIFKEKSKTKKNIFITLLCSNGVQKNEYYLSTIAQNLKLEDLF